MLSILGFFKGNTQPLTPTGNVTLAEAADPAVFKVTLTPASRGSVTVNYATDNSSALSPSDYTATIGTLYNLILCANL